MTCPACGQEPPGEFPFCPFCGAALKADAPRAGREERKVVSILFADLVGFTSRAERMDPEDVRAMLASYHSRLRGELGRFGGTVEKFIGDAVMAVFGAPVTHEDDAERAVRAALAICDWAREHPENPQVRVAVNTGEALVTLDARPGEGEAMVAGDVVNTAARLQSAAPVNGVVVGEQTHRATAGVFDFRPVDPITAKGKAGPVPAWEVVAARARLGVDVTRQTGTPLVGRARELDLLVSAFVRVRAERAPQLITISGVPGIGKSRIVAEMLHAAEQEPELVRWRQGRSLPYGDGVTFWALSEIVKAEAGILDTDAADDAAAKLDAAVERLLPDLTERQWVQRQLRPLIGSVDTRGGTAEEMFAAWRRFLEALAEERPTVVVFEDLHWADDALLDFVDGLVERTSGIPLLVIATARPELLQRRPAWGGGKPNAMAVALTPLADNEAALLVGNLLERRLLDADVQATLLERAGGNPLYAEQYARIINERGNLDNLPATVHGLIAARLDALSEDEKQLLQNAAVVGKVFWIGAVELLGRCTRWQAEELLHALERKEFVQRARASSVGGDAEYAFRHALIRDVAYGQIPRATRAEKHRRSAEWVESLGRPDDHAEMLAYHYLQALDLATAAGLDTTSLGASARFALRDAGDRAAALFAGETAAHFYDAALRIWPDDVERARLLLRRACPIRSVGAGDRALLEEAHEALLRHGDRVGAAEAEMLLSQVAWHEGRLQDQVRHDNHALELISGTPSSSVHAYYLARRAMNLFLRGDHAGAIASANEALAMAEELGDDEAASQALHARGSARSHSDGAAALADVMRSIELARAAGAKVTLSRGYNSLSVVHTEQGDLRASAEAHGEAARLALEIGSASEKRWFLGTSNEPPFRRGDWDRSLALSQEFLDDIDAGSPHYLTAQPLLMRAHIRLARGSVEAAAQDVERALVHARRIGEPQVLYYVLGESAYLLANAGELRQAEALLDEWLDRLSSGADLQFAIIAAPSAALAAVELGRHQQLLTAIGAQRPSPWTAAMEACARGDFVAAAQQFEAIGSLPHAAHARLHAAETMYAVGKVAEADQQLQLAQAFYRPLNATLFLRRCEQLAMPS